MWDVGYMIQDAGYMIRDTGYGMPGIAMRLNKYARLKRKARRPALPGEDLQRKAGLMPGNAGMPAFKPLIVNVCNLQLGNGIYIIHNLQKNVVQ